MVKNQIKEIENRYLIEKLIELKNVKLHRRNLSIYLYHMCTKAISLILKIIKAPIIDKYGFEKLYFMMYIVCRELKQLSLFEVVKYCML